MAITKTQMHEISDICFRISQNGFYQAFFSYSPHIKAIDVRVTEPFQQNTDSVVVFQDTFYNTDYDDLSFNELVHKLHSIEFLRQEELEL